MVFKGYFNWKGFGNLFEFIGIIYMLELKLEIKGLNNYIFIIFRIRKIE